MADVAQAELRKVNLVRQRILIAHGESGLGIRRSRNGLRMACLEPGGVSGNKQHHAARFHVRQSVFFFIERRVANKPAHATHAKR
ncbi:hypothetical protein [Paraburkholderia sp. GAS334]|uniref:hypothetical protein n=1 Tax=Paraburkholderia sp. GAS334 TaxID=3035131 RepID=UPI003D236194